VPVSPWWPTLTLVWVCVQGAFGALTVTMKLFPAIVTLHLLGGLALLALLCVQAVRYAQAWHETTPVPLSATTRWLLIATFAAGLPAGRAGRLGQHQLRGAGLQ
jgi:cytochrome c oxidase assembly protein subunit 15